MSILSEILSFIVTSISKANDEAIKGNNKAKDMTDEEIRYEVKHSSKSTAEKIGMAREYKERHPEKQKVMDK